MPEIDLTDLGIEECSPQAETLRAIAKEVDAADAADATTDTQALETNLDNCILCPTTGEVVDLANADELIDCLERITKLDQTIYAAKQRVKSAIADLCTGDQKTRYVRGQRRRAKVESPSDSWDQPRLKEAWNSYPQHRESALKIATIGVKLMEFKKMEKESGPADFEQFRNMVAGAKKPSGAAPTITIEE